MKLHFLFLFLFCLHFLYGQETSNWKNYTDMKNVRSVYSAQNGLWAASTGGGFFYNTQTGEFLTLHKNDGLVGSSLNAAAINEDGKVWFGGEEGAIDVYDPATKQLRTILDIYNDTEQSNRSINDLESIGDTIYACTDFGLSLIDSKSYLFYDTFFKYGNFQPYIKVNSSLKAGLIYLATSAGVAIQKEGAENLSAPESWNTYTTQNGLPSNNVSRIVKMNNSVIAATDKGLSVMNDSTWSSFLVQFNNTPVNDLLLRGDSLFIAVGKIIYLYSNNNLAGFDTSAAQINKLAYSNSLGLLAASSSGIYEVRSKKYRYPNGPQANQFPELTVDNSGNLWSASGKDNTGVGFYKYDGNEWTNYNRVTLPQLLTNGYNFVDSPADDEVYFGSWGRGFTSLKNGTFKNFTASDIPLTGLPGSPNFLVISGFGKDSKGNLWVLDYWPGDSRALGVMHPDSTWNSYANPSEFGQSYEEHYSLAVDPYDTKWYCIRNTGRLGLLYFNENNPSDSTDNKFGFLNTDAGLNSNFIYSVVVDKRGDIWVGTGLGVNIITNNGSILNNTPSLRITSVFTLRQQTINVMAVDPLNNKWIGTNQGLLLVNSDGSSLLATYNSKNSPLLSDQIRSLAVDPNSGRVYVGTDEGITSFDTPAVKPEESFSKLFVYPNPFIVNDGDNKLTIDGLIKDTDIKILNIEGKLIKEFSSPGGRIASWDGKDQYGAYVGSGIYLVVAFDKEGNNVITGKVAVLHK